MALQISPEVRQYLLSKKLNGEKVPLAEPQGMRMPEWMSPEVGQMFAPKVSVRQADAMANTMPNQVEAELPPMSPEDQAYEQSQPAVKAFEKNQSILKANEDQAFAQSQPAVADYNFEMDANKKYDSEAEKVKRTQLLADIDAQTKVKDDEEMKRLDEQRKIKRQEFGRKLLEGSGELLQAGGQVLQNKVYRNQYLAEGDDKRHYLDDGNSPESIRSAKLANQQYEMTLGDDYFSGMSYNQIQAELDNLKKGKVPSIYDIKGGSGKHSPEATMQWLSKYNGESIVQMADKTDKVFKTVQDLVASGRETGAQDMAILTYFAKMLDPESVVREGEFKTAEQRQGAFEALKGMWDKISNGTILNDNEGRQKFVDVMGVINNANRTARDTKLKQYVDTAPYVNANPEVFTKFNYGTVRQNQPPAPPPAQQNGLTETLTDFLRVWNQSSREERNDILNDSSLSPLYDQLLQMQYITRHNP